MNLNENKTKKNIELCASYIFVSFFLFISGMQKGSVRSVKSVKNR